MISKSGVHLPDTTYGGNPIAWKNADDSDEGLRRIRDENAELRELCGDLLDNLMSEICAKAWWCKDKDWRACKDDACGNYTFVILARELGVEL